MDYKSISTCDQFSSFDNDNQDEKCIAFECEHRHPKRSSQMCRENSYSVTCDNGVELKDNYADYQAAADECSMQDSFIKWYPENYCNTNDHDGLQQKYWTSGTRHIETFRLRKSYITIDLTLEKCYILEHNDEDEDDDYIEEDKSCVKTSPFYCTFGGNEDKGDIVSLPTVNIPQQKSAKSDKIGSIAAGTVTSIVAVIAVILAIFFRRRLSKKKTTGHDPNLSESEKDTMDRHVYNKTPKPVVYHEIKVENLSPHNGKFKYPQTVNNITYDNTQSNCTTKWQNVNQVTITSIQSNMQSDILNYKAGQKGYEMAKVNNVARDCSESLMVSNYGLATPISSNAEGDSDQYAFDRDYDHLENIKKTADPVTQVYDHLPTTVTEDSTYDHSTLKIVLDKEDCYAHFKIDAAHA